jgi:predicted transposase YbfD/YdcC
MASLSGMMLAAGFFPTRRFPVTEQPSLSLLHHFRDLPDPRVERTREHLLLDILAIAVCAVIGGADDWVAIETFAQAKHDWFARFLTLPNGIPSHDTFGRVFARLDPTRLAEGFQSWMAAVCQRLGLRQVALDGKILRRSHDRGKGKAALHLVSAWATENSLTLGQVAVADKSNEITAIPQLLQMLDVAGALVTIDAMGCQKEIASAIIEQEADYLLAVKENQPRLYEDIEQFFHAALDGDFVGVTHDYAETAEVGHGRGEQRGCWVFGEPTWIRDRSLWADLRSVIVVVRTRDVDGKSSSELHYYISSRQAKAVDFLQATRCHWRIENNCHWVLDVSFAEDQSRIRKDHGAENFAWLRRMALSLLKRVKGVKGGVRCRRLKAGWDTTFLERVLNGFNEE